MEGYVNLYINFVIQYRKKYMELEEFNLNIYSISENEIKTKENIFHIKFVRLTDIKENQFVINYFKQSLFIKTENNDECKFWINAIEKCQKKYEKFYEEFYENSKKIKLSMEFETILNITEILDKNLKNIVIDNELEQLLNKNNNLKKKLIDYSNEIDKFYFKLNSGNSVEAQVKNKAKEMKTLFNELHNNLNNCTYGLNSHDITNYLNEFSENLKKKILETQNLVDEIKYIFKNYVSLKIDYLEQKNIMNTETREEIINENNFKETDLFNFKLKNAQLELLIEEKQSRIDVINIFINDL